MLCVCNILVDINVDNIHCTIKKRNFRERKKFKNLLVNEVAAVAADKMKINAPLLILGHANYTERYTASNYLHENCE